MTPKEYLQQAFFLDQQINNKLQHIESLRSLATKVTSNLSPFPKQKYSSPTAEDTLVKMIDLSEQVNQDIDSLVDLKKNIYDSIMSLQCEEEKTILEKRYVCFIAWEQIALDMGYSLQNCFKIHKRALTNIKVPSNIQE